MTEVFLNGDFETIEDACVSAMDAGLLLGAGLFETLRAYDRTVFRIDDHLQRLFASAQALEIPIALAADQIADALAETLDRNGLDDARCRITVTRGALPGEVGAEARPTCLVTAGVMTPYDEQLYARGMTVTVSDATVNPSDPTAGHKTTAYMTNLLVLRDAHARGAQEALRLNTRGRLCEGAISNVFLVRQGRLLTPPLEEGCLPGVTRKVVLEIARREGIDAAEESIAGPDLLKADELFLTNTIMEVMPVCRIERHPVGNETVGPITQRLMRLYREQVESEIR
ncbi:MAG: branched-chain amino acid aminotransferase [Phycisphaerae bacterium]|nr:branched-chain amino acid aminotransferase [Phycisphaerae bacterium]